MKDLLIILLLLGLLWGGYKGMVLLGDFAQPDTAESIRKPLADNAEKRLNQSAIKEMKKAAPALEKKKVPAIKKTEVVTPPTEKIDGQKTDGQKAMEAVRGTRLDSEGKARSKEDFYKEPDTKEARPYDRGETTTKKAPTANESDIKEQKAALAEKGKALAGEFKSKGNSTPAKKAKAKAKAKTSFNIEKGEEETETPAPPARPQEYSQPVKEFVPSKYVLVVGSFASADNAVKEVLRLKKAGFPKASIVLSEKNLNLISLGSFTDRAAANAQAAEIKKSGIDLYVKAMR